MCLHLKAMMWIGMYCLVYLDKTCHKATSSYKLVAFLSPSNTEAQWSVREQNIQHLEFKNIDKHWHIGCLKDMHVFGGCCGHVVKASDSWCRNTRVQAPTTAWKSLADLPLTTASPLCRAQTDSTLFTGQGNAVPVWWQMFLTSWHIWWRHNGLNK